MFTYTSRAGITAAAGTRLALYYKKGSPIDLTYSSFQLIKLWYE